MAKKTKAAVTKAKLAVSPPPTKAAKPAAKTSGGKSPVAKAPKTAASKTAKAPAKASTPKSAVVANVTVASPVSPASDTIQNRFDSFEDAKSATIDALLKGIEDAEARLVEAKRASTFAQLEQLSNGHR